MDVSKLKVAELRKELKDRGLPTTGTKPELAARLLEAVQPGEGEFGSEASKENASAVEAEKSVEFEEDVEDILETKEEEKTEPPPAKKIALSTGVAPESEKLQKRAERFGLTSEELKKEARAARFNLQKEANDKKSLGTANVADVEKLKQRADRFGTVVSQSLTKAEEAERIQKRKERFGEVTKSAPKKASITFSKPSGLSPADEEKRRKRAERFGLS